MILKKTSAPISPFTLNLKMLMFEEEMKPAIRKKLNVQTMIIKVETIFL